MRRVSIAHGAKLDKRENPASCLGDLIITISPAGESVSQKMEWLRCPPP